MAGGVAWSYPVLMLPLFHTCTDTGTGTAFMLLLHVNCRKRVKHKMDHLVCFVPAMLALGSHMGAVTGSKADQYMQLAENLTETCWQMYATQPTGQLFCDCLALTALQTLLLYSSICSLTSCCLSSPKMMTRSSQSYAINQA